jgi:hypothetical protein
LIRHEPLTYPGFGTTQARCEIFIDDASSRVVAVEVPENQTTSVTNAVEQVRQKIHRLLGRDFKLYTIAPFDPFKDWGVFRVDFDREGSPSWVRMSDSTQPEVLARAMTWAEQKWRGQRRGERLPG